MGEMNLIYLLVGVGLGILVSRYLRSSKEPAVWVASVPQEVATISVTSHPEQESMNLAASVSQQTEQAEQEDIQPLKEELKQTQLAYEMAKQMSDFKSGFLARTSHELRSPLSSLIGMHQLILSGLCDSPEEAQEFVAQANVAALKMVKVLDDVIAVAKTEHGTNRLEIQSLPLTQVFENLYSLTHMQAANRNIPLEVVSPAPEIYVLADSRRFLQVLVGLVSTAIAQVESGSIQVSATSSPSSVEAQIWIDIESSTSVWSETVDLLSTNQEEKTKPGDKSEISPGLTLLMVQTLVEVMGGCLKILEVSGKDSSSEHFTRLQCSMPLGNPETVELAMLEE
jgi:signal transduction histidine kinase